ncbi:Crp/Fnr family transcriptional regulator [Texcoconibacillus texcoconensis]|uniref:CRP/FNR family transcriptional regulator n=1 Tax=Texcoconibacillus texcoconensis TaxID=1095777 RepID=A0A840QRT7_9BACI|nr:Crp/Fnr family transcriptional regulator [Texcoconibacillus texcoconensis]MBB5174192.1 CRP/FNR family transcriptional regulator [Texcoconibacillus texcoconensis]
MKKTCCQHQFVTPCTKKVPIFHSLSEEEMQKIADMAKHESFQKGSPVVQEGDSSQTLFIVNKGRVKVSKTTVDGKEQILHLLTCGEFFGELNLFNGSPSQSISVYALESTEICLLRKQDIDQVMEENPNIAFKLLETVTNRLAHTENLVQNLATKDPEVRLVHMILEFSEKFGTETEKGIEIDLTLSREEIANYIGVTRETISRKLSKFEDLNFITAIGNKQLIVKDIDLLEEYVI